LNSVNVHIPRTKSITKNTEKKRKKPTHLALVVR
jgi:hypothetical protein